MKIVSAPGVAPAAPLPRPIFADARACALLPPRREKRPQHLRRFALPDPAINLRRNACQPLLTLSRIEHGLLLPILLHCTDDAGRPMLGPTRPGPEGEEFLRTAYHDIPVVVPAIREYWMPQRPSS